MERKESTFSPYHILYFSFDEEKFDLSDIQKHKVFIFLYDLNPNIKIFITGSAQITMWKKSRESLAGRFFDFRVESLNFEEYLDFIGVEIDWERGNLFEKDLKNHMMNFLRTGGFIEAIFFDEIMLRKYIKESILERVFFIDIPQTFGVKIPEIFYKILNIFASHVGIYLDYKNLSNDLNIDHRTLESYISYLEFALFVQKLYNFSPNFLTSEKKIKKGYLSNTAFTLALNPKADLSLIFEQFFINMLNARFFFRSPQKEEIDIVYQKEDKILPVEIKLREKIDKEDFKGLMKFMRKFNLRRSLLITLNLQNIFKLENFTIYAFPYWKYNNIKRSLESLLS